MRLRIFTEPEQGAKTTSSSRWARTAEDLGFDAFFRYDHYERFGRLEAVSRVRTSAASVVCCGADEDEYRRRADNIGRAPDELRENGAAGLPAEVVETLAAYGDAGAQTVYLQVLDLDDLDDLDHLGLLATEVMSEVATR